MSSGYAFYIPFSFIGWSIITPLQESIFTPLQESIITPLQESIITPLQKRVYLLRGGLVW